MSSINILRAKFGYSAQLLLPFSQTSEVLNNHLGYADYNDSSSAASPVDLVAETWTNLPNDGLGPFSQNQLPDGGPTTLSTNSGPTILAADGAIDCSSYPLHSDIIVRLDYTVTPNVNNASLSFRYQLGSGAEVYFLERSVGRLGEGAGRPYRQSLLTDYIYLGDTNTRDNPIYPQVKLSSGGTVVNAGMAIKVYNKGSS